jgi:hypothetical protein
VKFKLVVTGETVNADLEIVYCGFESTEIQFPPANTSHPTCEAKGENVAMAEKVAVLGFATSWDPGCTVTFGFRPMHSVALLLFVTPRAERQEENEARYRSPFE